jgi:O-methyltransferase involved in polyketide biosynthesis
MRIAITEFSPVEQTAFVTAYARALDSRWPRPILGDTWSAEIVGKIDYDFEGLGVPSSAVRQTALRAKMLDDRVRAFISQHPHAIVVALGAGVDTGVLRVEPPATVDWYNVDLPHVIALREEVLPPGRNEHSVAGSLADDDWADQIPSDRPTMLVADGLLAFLTEPVVINLFRRIPGYFRAGELALNDYGRVGRLNILAMKVAFSAVGNQWRYRGFTDARLPETWSPRLKLIEEVSLANAPEVDLFPAAARWTKSGARGARILRYRF